MRYRSETVLAYLTPVTLNFHPVTLTSIGFLSYLGQMCGLSLSKEGQCVLELLVGNKNVIDGSMCYGSL